MSQKTNVHLARCPHCDSTFEVSNEELELAFGAVRCGECMKIFNANFHRIDPPHSVQKEDQEPETPANKDPIPTLHEPYQQPDVEDEEDFQEPEEEWLDEEMLAFEAELEVALSDPEETEDQFPAEIPEAEEPASDPSLDEELVTESRDPQPHKKAKKVRKQLQIQDYRKSLLALAAVLVASLASLGAWSLWSPQTSSHWVADEVRISPSTSPQKMEVHFQLSNQGRETYALPDLQVDLLNLSRQVIATQTVDAVDIKTDIQQIEAGGRQALHVEVERPSTFVQNARIIPLTP